MKNRLTVGMATYEDFDGVYFTLEALRTYHGEEFDIVVVNNAPRFDKRLDKVIQSVGGKHYHRPDLVGTSASRDAVFRFAQTPWVLVIDSHVLIEPDGIKYVNNWISGGNTPYSSRNAIHTGPLVGDDGKWIATHWDPKLGKTLDGTWGISPYLKDAWLNRRFAFNDYAPFEIPMQGLGLWFAYKEEWPGFNYRFRGFGGEEGYIHEIYRQRGGKALCHPQLRWRHRFRDIAGWDLDANGRPIAIVPYPLHLEDHVWNLLVGHRELGIEGYAEAIWQSHGQRLGRQKFDQLVKAVEFLQPFGETKKLPDLTIRGVWYTNNKIPQDLMRASLSSIRQAAQQSRHKVDIRVVPWTPVATGFPQIPAEVDKSNTPHQQILSQIRQGTRGEFDVVAFLEHDVIYPVDYFDRVAFPFAATPGTTVVLNDSCIGLDHRGFLNKTSWNGVEPLHEMAMSREAFEEHMTLKESEASNKQSINLEPANNTQWTRVGKDTKVFPPSIHVNHSRRLTNHGEVCFNDAAPKPDHPYWGSAKLFWPKNEPASAPPPVAAPEAKSGGCGCQNPHVQQAKFTNRVIPQSTKEWYEAEREMDPDFKEHMGTLADLARQVTHATVMTQWPKRAYLAIAQGLSTSLLGTRVTLVDIASSPRTWWTQMTELFHGSFKPVVSDPIGNTIDPTDLLFLDVSHDGKGLYESLVAHHGSVSRWIVLHATNTFGVQGETKGQVGMGFGVRRFLKEHPEWTAIRHDLNNHGLMVLSKDARDKDVPPSMMRKALNFAQAKVKHVADGNKLVPPEVFEERINTCITCPHRVHDACGACGCPIEKKASWASEECGLVKLGMPPKWTRHTEKEQES